MRIILASGSPRRRELLSSLGMFFEVYKPDVDESRFEHEAPEALCMRLSKLKAESAANKFPDDLIIAADTVVVIDGLILGKPKNREDASRMLAMLSGREHTVITGVCVRSGNKVLSHAESTRVRFRSLTHEEITAYVSTGECDDKAGAYAVQGKGALIVESLCGDYFNVVGLPLCALGKMLSEAGLDILR